MTYRIIDVSHLPPVMPADQAAPSLDWIRIADLVIDDRYQRALTPASWHAIQKIAAAFQWAWFSPVLISPIAGGRYAVIDGQHRCHAAALCGFASVPCMVVHIAPSDQARAFAGVNGNVSRITIHQLYRASLVAGEDWAVQCRDVVAAAGCALATANPSAKDRKAGMVYCIGMVRNFVARGHGSALRGGLAAIAGYGTTGRVALYSDYILNPWVTAIAEVPGAACVDLAPVLRCHDPFRVLAAADRMTASASGRTATARKDAFVVLIRRHMAEMAVAS